MKKLLILFCLTGYLMASDYYSIVQAMTQVQIDKYNNRVTAIQNNIEEKFTQFTNEFNSYNRKLLDTSASMVAISNIDFNPNHQGFSAGIGVATINSDYGNGIAYALGAQYAYENIAINVKGAYRENNNYIIGSGLVISF